MSIEVAYASPLLVKSFWNCLNEVAKERVYIEMTEAPPLSSTEEFQKKLRDNNWPVFYAVDGGKVVGWADISCSTNPRLKHRASLGMGLAKDYRGRLWSTQKKSGSRKSSSPSIRPTWEPSRFTKN